MKKVPSQDYSKKGIINKADVIKVIWRQQKGMANLIDGKKNLIRIVDELEEVMQNKSLAALCESTSSVSCMAVPRRQEIFACFDRYRALRLV